MKLDYKIFFKTFVLSFIIFNIILYFTIGINQGFKNSLILLTSLISLPISLFMSFNTFKILKSELLIINSLNKNPRLGLKHYHQEILSFLKNFSYKLATENFEEKIYKATGRSLLISIPITVRYSPYQIEVIGPRHLIRILSSHLDLKKTKLD